MTDWRDVGARLLSASPALKKALGLKDGITPSEAVRRVVDQAPELGEFVDLDEIDEDISRWQTLRKDRTAATQAGWAADKSDLAYKAARFAASPGVELVSTPFRMAGKLGADETPGTVARELAGEGVKGSLVGGITDALVDPINAATMVATGGGSIGAKELLKKVGTLGLAEQGVSLGQVGYEHGIDSPAFKEGVAASAGGLLAGVGLPAVVGAARARVAPPRVPVGKTVEIPAPLEAPAPASDVISTKPTAAADPVKLADPAKIAPPEYIRVADEGIGKAETQVKAAKAALDYQRAQRLGTGNEERRLSEATAALEAAKVRAQTMREFDSLGDDDKSWIDTIVGVQEAEGATKVRPSDDISRVFSKEGSTAARREMGLEGTGKREMAGGLKRTYEEGFDKVAEAMGLPEPTTNAERIQRDEIVTRAIEAGRTGKQVLTPQAIEEGAAGIPYREMAAAQGWDIDDLAKLHKRIQAGGELKPNQIERYVAAVKAARRFDLGRGMGESYTYQDHLSRRALGKAAQADVENLDAEPVGVDVDTSFDPATFGDDAMSQRELAAAEFLESRKVPYSYFQDENGAAAVADSDFPGWDAKRDVDTSFDPATFGDDAPKNRPKRPWDMTLEEFREAVGRGKLHQATGQAIAGESEATSPIQMGELNGYSDDDIAHFYAKRAGIGTPNKLSVEIGYDELLSDAIMEGRKDGEWLGNASMKPIRKSTAHVPKGGTGTLKAVPPKTPPPQAPVPPGAPAGPKETPVDLSAPPSWSVERPPVPPVTYADERKAGSGPIGAAAKAAKYQAGQFTDELRSGLQTVRSELIHKGFKNVAGVISKVGIHDDFANTEARAKFDQMKLVIPEKDLGRLYHLAMTGGKPEGKDARGYQIFRQIFDPQYKQAAAKDPSRGIEGESLTGVAPPEGVYWPMKWERPDAPTTIDINEPFRPLDTTGESKAPSLYKGRVPEGDSVPVLTYDELENIAFNRARTVGALEGAATKARTPDAYPAIFKAIYADERRKHPGPSGQAEAEAAARVRLDEIQLPDLFEAAARDMPDSTWSDIIKDKTISRAADEVIKGRSAMPQGTRERITKVKEITRTSQLGFAAPLNYAGLLWAPGRAYGAARRNGAGVVGAAAQAAKVGAKAVGNAAVNTASEVGHAVGRAVGATDKLSPGQAAFGRSRSKNPVMRAIAMTDRSARLAVAQSLRDVIPTMKHEDFLSVDRTLPMSHPKNVKLAQREIANGSQGLGTLADKLKATGNPLADWIRELGAQYMGPELRQAEKMMLGPDGKINPALGAGGAVVSLGIAAPIIGEGVNNMRAAMRGSGFNLPGAETTEDQEEKPLRSTVATDRDPRILVRAAQNIAATVPFGKQVVQSYEYGDLPLMGTAPAVGLAKQIYDAGALYKKTGDLRAWLSIVNAPGFGRDWAKIVKYEEARKKNPKNGMGGVPQNLTLPWKIQAYLDGTMTAEQVLSDSFGQGGPTLPMEKKAVQHRDKANRKKEAAERKKK